MDEPVAHRKRKRRSVWIAVGALAGLVALIALLGVWGVVFAALVAAGYGIDAAVGCYVTRAARRPSRRPRQFTDAALRQSKLARARSRTAERFRGRATTPFTKRLARFTGQPLEDPAAARPATRSRMDLTVRRPIGPLVPPKPRRWIRRMLDHIQWLVRDWPARERRVSLRRILPLALRKR